MQQVNLVDENNNTSTWQASTSNIAWGTILMFLGIIMGYVLVIGFTLNEQISYPVATLICSYLAFASFTVTHDAGHGSIFKMGSPLKPLESIIGWGASIPMLIMPFRIFQKIHDRHHAFTNDPDRDPDYIGDSTSWWDLLLKLYYTPFGYHVKSVTSLRHIKAISNTYRSSVVYMLVVYVPLITLSINGYALEVLFLAIIPIVIAIFFLIMFFDYIPHRPHKSLARYQNTRIYGGRILNMLLLGQNYHLIHHMYPRLPWYKYQEVFIKTKSELESHGAPIEKADSGFQSGFMKSSNANKLVSERASLHHVLKVSTIERLTSDSVAVSLDLPEGETLRYRAGQYVTVSKWLAGEQQTRCYSLCGSPETTDSSSGNMPLKIGVRATLNGLVSSYINQTLNVGDELVVQGPFGDFIYPPIHEKAIENLVLIAGGSGITPVLSILETALLQSSVNNIYLVYACCDESSIMFFDHLKKLQSQHSERLHLHYVINEPGQKIFGKSGRLDNVMLSELLPMLNTGDISTESIASVYENTEFYVCGPEGLKNVVVESLDSHDIDVDRVHVEEFVATRTEPLGELHKVDIALANGEQHSLKVAVNQNVLEVAKAEGIVLPHACGNGTCGSCKLKVDSGNLLDIPDSIPGIVAEEKAAGYTLACQCQPLSDIKLSEKFN